MSWYDSDWTHRAPILIDNHSGASTIDVTATVPGDFTRFWENVDGANGGADIRVTDADGQTLLTFDVASFNATTRTATIEIDNLSASSTTSAIVAWLYWGASSKSTAVTAFSPQNPKTGYIEIGAPGSGSQRMVKCGPETPGATNPRAEIHKASGDRIHLWWDLTGVLAKRSVPSQNSRALDEIASVTYDLQYGTNGTSDSAMVVLGELRMIGPAYVRTTVRAGNSGTNYTAVLDVTLTSGRILDFRATIRVQDVIQPS